MSENASAGPSIGNRILDTVIGLWTLLLLLPVLPFLVILWLWDRFKRDDSYES